MKRYFLIAASIFLVCIAAPAAAEEVLVIDPGQKIHVDAADPSCQYDECWTENVSLETESADWHDSSVLRVEKEPPAEDTDGVLTLSYQVECGQPGSYQMRIRATQPYGSAPNYFSPWKVQVNGVSYGREEGLSAGTESAVGETQNHFVDVTLQQGTNTITFYVEKRYGNGEMTDLYFLLDEFDFFYHPAYETDLQPESIKKNYIGNDWSGREALQIEQNVSGAETKYITYKVNAPKNGVYRMETISSQLDHGYLSQFDIVINETRYTSEAVKANQLPEEPVPNPTTFFRTYTFDVQLHEGENTIRFEIGLDTRNQDRILFYLDKVTLTCLPQQSGENLKVEGERYTNPGDAYPGGSYYDAEPFSGGRAFGLYKSAEGYPDETCDIQYTLDAAQGDQYTMGLLCGVLYESAESYNYGIDFDIAVNGTIYPVRGHVTRTENTIPGNTGGSPVECFLYAYNEPVYLRTGLNNITVQVKQRPGNLENPDFILLLDYLDFTLREADAEFALEEVAFNDAALPIPGENRVSFSVVNNTQSTDAPLVVAAVYREDMLVSIETPAVQAIEPNGKADFQMTVTLSAGDKIKLFLWDRNTLIPFCKPYEQKCPQANAVLNVAEEGQSFFLSAAVTPTHQARQAAYTILDYWGEEAASGTAVIPSDTEKTEILVPPGLETGWYQLQLEGEEDSTFFQ